MKKKLFLSFFLYSVSLALLAQSNPSKLFEDFKNKSKNSVLPDFSYVGYQCGEKEIPNNKEYKVFDVTKYGAIPNDDKSDKVAIQKAIDAANRNGSGIILFPKGRFLVNEDGDAPVSINSKCSKIILRGSGSGANGTELYMKNTLQPTNPKQMWTVPSLFQMNPASQNQKVGNVKLSSALGSFTVYLNNTDGLNVNDWIVLKMRNNSPELISDAVAGRKTDLGWTELLDKGVSIQVYYRVVSINGPKITLHAPLAYPIDPQYNWEVLKMGNSEEVGVEDLAFVGNWHSDFKHHRSWQDDSGYSMLCFNGCVNSWLKNCRFTDCNAAAAIKNSANMTITGCVITGTSGHLAIDSNGSTNILMSNLIDSASMWHSFGVAGPSINTVICHCKYSQRTCFESHSSQPRNTLLDCVEGGLLDNRGGGSVNNMPNHLTGLVMWNYHQINEARQDFEFWPSAEKTVYWRVASPIISGYTSIGTTFKQDQLGALESLGKAVEPLSLYEAQLQLRMKK